MAVAVARTASSSRWRTSLSSTLREAPFPSSSSGPMVDRTCCSASNTERPLRPPLAAAPTSATAALATRSESAIAIAAVAVSLPRFVGLSRRDTYVSTNSFAASISFAGCGGGGGGSGDGSVRERASQATYNVQNNQTTFADTDLEDFHTLVDVVSSPSLNGFSKCHIRGVASDVVPLRSCSPLK